MGQLAEKIRLPAILIVAVSALVLTTHWPALSAKAQSFDDQQYVTGNVLVQNPSWNSAKRFLTEVFQPSTVKGYYQPLTMISLMLDSYMGGSRNNLLIFHRTSLVIHTLNVALIIVLLYMLFGNIWAAAAVGLLFGLHPMTVEPIPWLSERKTLLATFFSFSSLIFYVRFARTNNRESYAFCFLCYLLALLSKPTSLPLPAAMLLMDYWPLKRLTRRSFWEKLPLFILASVFAVITLISQNHTAGTSLPGQYEHHLQNVPLIVCHDVIFYLAKMLWPVNLSSHYAYPEPFNFSNPYLVAAVAAAIALIFLLVFSLRWTAALLTGWLIFFITILPTMQVLRFSDVIASDKFAYLPSIGLLMLLASFLIWVHRRTSQTIIITVIVLLLGGAEAVAARRYLAYWQDSITLYKHMLSLAPNSVPLYGNLAVVYSKLGRSKEAIELLQKAISLKPNEGLAYYNLGVLYLDLNRYNDAIDAFNTTLKFAPDYADAYVNLGAAYGALGRFKDALEAAEYATKFNPDSVDAYINLGFAYGNLGDSFHASQAYARAVKISPNNPKAHFGFGLACLRNGDAASAIKQYEILKDLEPNSANQLLNLIKK